MIRATDGIRLITSRPGTISIEEISRPEKASLPTSGGAVLSSVLRRGELKNVGHTVETVPVSMTILLRKRPGFGERAESVAVMSL